MYLLKNKTKKLAYSVYYMAHKWHLSVPLCALLPTLICAVPLLGVTGTGNQLMNTPGPPQ